MKAHENIARIIPVTPSFVAKGADNNGSGIVTYALPAGTLQNDILLVVMECDDADTIVVPTGYAHITGSPFIDAGATTQGAVMWKRHTGSEANVAVADPGDHQVGYMLAIRGCTPAGNPWDVANSGSNSAGTSQTAVSGLITTRTNTLVYLFAANGHDPAGPVTTYYSNWSCAALGGTMTERGDFHEADGGGGGIGCAEGPKTTAGAVGSITFNIIDAETTAWLAVAFRAPGT